MAQLSFNPSEKTPNLAGFGMDKFFLGQIRKLNLEQIQDSQKNLLSALVVLYFKVQVMDAPIKTQQAKQRDLEKFLQFFNQELGHEQIDGWTPAVTKEFQQQLSNIISKTTGNKYPVTTVNRIMATLRHFAAWLITQRSLIVGNPLAGVRDLKIEDPNWSGLTNTQILRLKTAIEQRIKACTKKNQDPLLEAAVFYLLWQTGLLESELVALNCGQYYNKALHQVLRTKNRRVNAKVSVPQEARKVLELYLSARPGANQQDSLFISRYGKRLKPQDVFRLCKRLAKQATIFFMPEEQFKFSPHMLRHTFLKKVTYRYGLHVAQQLSGNSSIREIFLYAKPSHVEIITNVDELFN